MTLSTQRPTQSPAVDSSVPSPSPDTTTPVDVDPLEKDVRAHNLARGRVHKTVDFSRKQGRKERSALYKAGLIAPSPRGNGRSGHRWKGANSNGIDMDIEDARATSGDYADAEVLPPVLSPLSPVCTSVNQPTEVSLWSFMTTKRRKASKVTDEYEVVPRVRSVIVLDEKDMSMEADETWEYIPRTSDKAAEAPWKSGLTYAFVLSAA